jgi:hypothetical protein
LITAQPGIKWLSCAAKRHSDVTLGAPRRRPVQLEPEVGGAEVAAEPVELRREEGPALLRRELGAEGRLEQLRPALGHAKPLEAALNCSKLTWPPLCRRTHRPARR